MSRGHVANVMRPKDALAASKNTRQFGWMPVSPADAAAKIREKFGDEFANALKVQL